MSIKSILFFASLISLNTNMATASFEKSVENTQPSSSSEGEGMDMMPQPQLQENMLPSMEPSSSEVTGPISGVPSESSTLTPEHINLLAIFFSNLAYYPHTKNSAVINPEIAKRTYVEYWKGKKPEIESSRILTAGSVGGDTEEGRKNLELLKDFKVEVVPTQTSSISSTPSKFITDYLDPSYTDLSKWKIKLIDGENGINYIIKSTEWTISAVVGYHPEKNILVVGIRGTDSSKVSDLVTDLAPTGRSVKDAHPLMTAVPSDARVPRGFLGYFESMGDEIHKAIEELVPDEKESTVKIIITGHSLGGAAANITASFIASMSELYGVRKQLKSLRIIDNAEEIPNFNIENIHLRTFGMPSNVGNQAFIDWAEPRIDIIHFSNPRDPVTHATVLGSYLTSKRVMGRYSQGTSKKWSNLQSVAGDSKFKNPLDPHSLTRYAQAIIEQSPNYEKLRLELGSPGPQPQLQEGF